MITPEQVARLQEGDIILGRSTVHTAEAYGQAWLGGQEFEEVIFVGVWEGDGAGIEVLRDGSGWVLHPADCKIIQRRGYNPWGEKAEVGMAVIVRNGEGTRRAYGEPGILARELVLEGKVLEVSANGNPYVLVHGLEVHWFAHNDWREEANVRGVHDPFKEAGGIPPRPKPKPVRTYEEKSEACRTELAKALQEGLPRSVTVATVWTGEKVQTQYTICHAFLRTYEGERVKYEAMYNYPNINPEMDGILGEIVQKGPTEERISTLIASKDPECVAYVEYIRFLCEDEVLSQAWVNPVLEDVLLHGFECDMDCPQVIAMTAYTASRLHYEYRFRLEFWWELVQRGVHPRVALVMQAFVNRAGPKFRFWSCTHGHQVFNSFDITMKGIRDLRDNTLPKMSKKQQMPISTGYHNFNEYFDGEGDTFRTIAATSPVLSKSVSRRCPLTGEMEEQTDYVDMDIPELAQAVAELCEEVV